MAGESAAEVARNRREKAERLLKQADAFDSGAEGERQTAVALAQLPAADWHVFHDVRWPGRVYANVDHVVVGPSGVFVVDSKNWSGNIVVKGDVLRQNGRSREKTVVGAAEAAIAVSELAPAVDPHLVHPVLCFVREEAVAGWARDVMVCSTGNLVSLLLSRPTVLDPSSRVALALELDAQLHAAAGTNPGVQTKRQPAVKPPGSKTPAKRGASPLKALVPVVVVIAVWWVISSHPAIITVIADWLTAYMT